MISFYNNKDIIMIFLLLLLLTLNYNVAKQQNNNNNDNIYYYPCTSQLNHYIKKEFDNKNIQKGTVNQSTIIFPCNNSFSIKNLKKINPKNKMFTYLSYSSVLGSKRLLWQNLNYVYKNNAINITPKTYLIPEDLKKLQIEYKHGDILIMKNDKQRQTGLKIVNRFIDVVDPNNKDYYLVQKYLKNPFLYQGYKVNFRVYLIVKCTSKGKYYYVFDDGISTYSKKKYIEGSAEFDRIISSFYTSELKYSQGFPLTIKNLWKKLNLDYNQQFKPIHKVLNKLCKGIDHKICSLDNYYGTQIFGVDIFMDNNIKNHKILEVNVGPGMKQYNAEDGEMRKNLHTSLINIMFHDKDNKMTLIFSS